MPPTDFPVDDNLRLIFSKDHQEWLDAQIAEARHMIMGYIVLIIVCLGWFAGLVYYNWSGEEDSCVTIPADRTIEQLWDEGVVSRDVKECPPVTSGTMSGNVEESWLANIRDYAVPLISLLALIMIPASIVDIIRNLFKLCEFKKFTRDHQAFLRKYNRL